MRKKIVPIGLSFLLMSAAGCQNKDKGVDKKLQDQQEMAMQRINEYERILATNPKDLEILVALGNVNYDMGRWKDAVENYLKALAIDSTNVDVRTDLGTAYKQMGLMELAEREFKKGIEINPKHAKAHYNLGVVYHDKGDYKATLAEWEKNYELEQDPYFKEIARKNIEQLKQTMTGAVLDNSLPAPKAKK
ncbi:MAG: tetratricopeptide repeat protein [bacterium]|nr:tetratricopeptide repeat protein [bacterium]